MITKEQSFKQVYKQSKDKIYRLCVGFMGNNADADDLFQEIIIKVWNKLDTFRKESNINTWIYRIATNTALLYIKKRNKSDEQIRSLKSEDLNIETIDNDFSNNEEEFKRLYKSISTLTEKDRIVISLVLEGSSYNEIADITGMSVSNVGVRINRIKKSLTKKMR